ncbi:lytic transglycosylase [Pantoea ananatis]|nr:lytic transglycosylase [Pantoea ananatis]KTR51111.1 lytic transglycosylase [Pantoea ananatis]KTR65490.1 lytic transglycosylase [Pantoea ananatis]KTR69721.1 lytic transglycosylase [Pantoea ananatis]
MPDGTEMIWKVAKAFRIDFKDLQSGAVDLCRIAEGADYLGLEEDNEARIARWRAANER